MSAPTLLVGIGGRGSDIVLRVAEKASNEQRKRISFVVLDTDVNDLESVKRKNPNVVTIQTSTNATVGEYLNLDTFAKEEWFPVNHHLNSKKLTEGAGQIRAISRLAFDTAIRSGGLNKLHGAIGELYQLDGNESEQALRVVVVSTLAGGTGAGLVLPIGMYIRNYLENNFRANKAIIRGFFLLPEILYDEIGAQSERNSLMANTYASLRELDAFFMKGASPEKDKRQLDAIRIFFPRAGSPGSEEYKVIPYDFCFLFGDRSTKSKELASYNGYLDHAATCIFAQSIGPMNERSNSSEDNVLKEIVKHDGKNRYAGAGASMLLYPKDDIAEYVANTWVSQCISDQWLKYDLDYKKKIKQLTKDEGKGHNAKRPTLNDFYVISLNNGVKNKDPFSMAIRRLCSKYDADNLIKTKDKWSEYIQELEKHTAASVEDNKNSATAKAYKRAMDNFIAKPEYSEFDEAYQMMIRNKNLTEKYVGEVASTISFNLFRSSRESVIQDRKPFQLESYLRDEEGKFIHPNAVRYFLLEAHTALVAKKKNVDKKIENYRKHFDGFIANNTDREIGEGVSESQGAALLKRNQSTLESLFRREDYSTLIDPMATYTSNVDKYRKDAVFSEVLQGAITYVDSLIEASVNLFKSMENSLEGVHLAAQRIPERYERMEGEPTKYVCSSRECFTALGEQMQFTGNHITLDGKLCEKIYEEMLKYIEVEEKLNESYYADFFDDVIMDYFRKQVWKIHGSKIDIDIISALEQEYKLTNKDFEPSNVRRHVIDTVEYARRLAQPFIETPVGEPKHPIKVCAYSEDLKIAGDRERNSLIDAALKGGIADEDLPTNEIVFYEAIYSLQAKDLSRFAPAFEGETLVMQEGSYYKAYHEVIEQIAPRSQDSKIITPHIDKMWHVTLPDLDDETQKVKDHNIAAALFWGILLDFIRYFPGQGTYQLRVSGEDGGGLKVSDSTQCIAFDEVFEALSINPIVVNRILSASKDRIAKDLQCKQPSTATDNLITKRLNALRLHELEKRGPRFEGITLSIFVLPMLFRIASGAGEFCDDLGVSIFEAILKEVKNYYGKICIPNQVGASVSAFTEDQLDRFMSNAQIYIDEFGKDCLPFIERLVNAAVGFVEELEQEAAKERMLSKFDTLYNLLG